MKAIRLITAAVFLVSAPALALDGANFGTARGLADSCSAMIDALSGNTSRIPAGSEGEFMTAGGMCLGFLQGFHNGVAFGEVRGLAPTYCIPNGVKDDQIARVLIKRVEQNPEIEHLDAGPFLAQTLALTWPCRR